MPLLYGATSITSALFVHAGRIPSCDCSSVITITRSMSFQSLHASSVLSVPLQVSAGVRLRLHDRVARCEPAPRNGNASVRKRSDAKLLGLLAKQDRQTRSCIHTSRLTYFREPVVHGAGNVDH